jgi:cation:H+ antiporter
MGGAEPGRPIARDVLGFLSAGLLPVPWLVAESFGGLGLPMELVATLSGLAILGGAFLLSWAMELAERDVPQSLAILVLALVSVLPEYAVDLHFAIQAGRDPSYAPYAVANMTGANRLLIGLGWPVVVLLACRRSKSQTLTLSPNQRLEVRFLLVATLYSLFIPLDGYINLVDAAALFLIFALYVVRASRGESPEVELVGPPALLDREFHDRGRRVWSFVLFVFAAYAIFVSAEPFAESLVHVGRNRDVDEFLLVQWVAPLASESPEFLIAILFAVRMRGSVGMAALISSKVNQWTLLVGAIPIAYSFSSSTLRGLALDARQTEELWLTSAQSLLAAFLISDLRFSRREAWILAVLFFTQLVLPWKEVRIGFIGIYVAVFLGMFAFGGAGRRQAFLSLFRASAPSSHRE